jgi:hypothetical protein
MLYISGSILAQEETAGSKWSSSAQMAAVVVAAAAPAAVVAGALAGAASEEWLAELGDEDSSWKGKVYLLTLSRLLPETLASRAGELRVPQSGPCCKHRGSAVGILTVDGIN